jgi:hypothetical protein
VHQETSVIEAGDAFIYFSYNNGDVVLQFSLDELRAIMRLFDVAQEDI